MATLFESDRAKELAGTLTRETYDFEGQESLITPILVYYKDIISSNADMIIRMTGGPHRLWPHMKTHKMEAVLRLLMEKGITKIKAATIAEAEIAARTGIQKVILAYPAVGPAIRRIVALAKAFPETEFFAIGDDLASIQTLSEACVRESIVMPFLADVNSGFDRTGVELDMLEPFLAAVSQMSGIVLRGLHWYDAQFGEGEPDFREKAVAASDRQLSVLFDEIRRKYPTCDVITLGGSPEFGAHTSFIYPYAYLSPGTVFIQDWTYAVKYPEMPYRPGGLILSRVISNPRKGYFTLDCGEKGISTINKLCRGLLVGVDHYEEVLMNEEHWVFRMLPGYESECPIVGDLIHIVPTHICPCSQLYPEVPYVSDHKLSGFWEVSARNRKLTY